MKKNKELLDIRTDIQTAIQIANEMKETLRVYRETLQTIFNDDAIPVEIREQYERLLVTQLLYGGSF